MDLFQQINNVVLDLQAADLKSYERPFRRLGQLLDHADLAEANRLLTDGLDYQAFLERSERAGGGMGGGALVWPEGHTEQLGMSVLLLKDLTSRPEHALHFAHMYFKSDRKVISGFQSMVRQLIIPFVRDYKAYVLANGHIALQVIHPKSNRVFIVHGHDEAGREKVARFLLQVGLQPIILHEQANRGRTIIEKVEANSDVGFAVVLLTPDDEGRKRGVEGLEPRVRQNVLLELGYFIGLLGRKNVCAFRAGDVEIPSDFAGVVWSPMDAGWNLELARELSAAGYSIDWNLIMRPPGAG